MWQLVVLCLFFVLPSADLARAADQPVAAIGPASVEVATARGAGRVPLFVSADWTTPRPEVTRAVLVFHGIRRNADDYFREVDKIRTGLGEAAPSVLLIAPQFLNTIDVGVRGMAPDLLYWRDSDWSGGHDATAPAPISSFEAIDAIIARLADRRLFPNLRDVIVAGHSAGGQIVQRYAVVGGAEQLIGSDVHLRYVVANPSSFLYFTPDRPNSDGRFAPFSDASCPAFNQWKFGFDGGLPRYVVRDAKDYAAQFAKRDITYLFGDRDIDPDHPAIDKSCMARAQGLFRFARGHNYMNYLKYYFGAEFGPRWHDIPGVGHDQARMFGSACGLAALFDRAGCS